MARNPPFVPVITILGVVATNIMLNLMFTREFAVKFEPVTVISVPEIPRVGDSVITPPATVNVADPTLPDASVAVIVCAPVLAVIGIVIVAVKVPLEVVVIVVGVVANTVVSSFIVIALFTLKFEPVTVILAPRLPAVEDKVTVPDTCTVKVAVAVFPVVSLAEIV